MRGYPNLYASTGVEAFIGSGSWFTQSLRANSWSACALGQVERRHQYARINWLLSTGQNDTDTLPFLIDNLGIEAGLLGSKFMLASAAKEDVLFELLRRAGYCVYGWQKHWKLDPEKLIKQQTSRKYWKPTHSIDQHEITKFQHKQLSAAARTVMTLADKTLPDFLWKENGVIKAYASIHSFGSKRVIHILAAHNTGDELEKLLAELVKDGNNNATWYFSQSNYLDWADENLSAVAAPITPRKEQMVKHFSIMEKTPITLLNHAADSGHPDPIAPFVHSSNGQDNL
jgi:hypothetical protein